MRVSRRELLAGTIAAPCFLAAAARSATPGGRRSATSFVDNAGVWRWADDSEVALFGVNYNVASASAFRFAKASGVAFERILDADFAHFRRLGFDALRLSYWGDWESSTTTGELIDNEHLAVLDQVVARAAAANMACLLSPIVTYGAAWPDALSQPGAGLSKEFAKDVLGTDPRAIAAQQHYLRALLARRNPITGRRYADEPAIAAVEPINEPSHHASDRAGSVRYIEALVGAIRDTGFAGPIFYNVSQDMAIASAIAVADVQGATFAWYPTGLQTGRAVEGNALLLVDDYAQMHDPALASRAKLVYEFDAADTMASYVYPAMVRAFRGGGAQFAAMFAYDALPIAAANSEFNDHFLNLAYTPAKAVSALIAACAMRELPRGGDYGRYPRNARFGAFRVDDRADLAELIDARRFYHSGDTSSRPPEPAALERLAGCGSSPVVRYDGTGTWFLDRISPGEWRLEVYPDAALVANPFEFRRPSRAAVRIVHRTREMRVDLADLGRSFTIVGTDGGRAARDGAFWIRPGVYRLSRSGRAEAKGLPPFYAPPADDFAPILQHEQPASLTAGAPWRLVVDIVSPEAPKTVALYLRVSGKLRAVKMRAGAGFRYEAVVPGDALAAGFLDYYVAAEGVGGARLWPGENGAWPGQWDFPRSGGFRVPVMPREAPLALFDAARDGGRIIVPYGGYAAFPAIGVEPDADGAPVVRIDGSLLRNNGDHDLPMQFAWSGALDTQGRTLAAFTHVLIEGHSLTTRRGVAGLILIERDGMAWGGPVALDPATETVSLALGSLRPVRAAMLPRDFPVGINPYWLRTPAGRGGPGDALRLADLQAVQVTIADRFRAPGDDRAPCVAIRRIALAR